MDGPALEEKQVLASAAPAAGLPGPDAVGCVLYEEEEASTNPSQDQMMHTIHKIAEIENLIPIFPLWDQSKSSSSSEKPFVMSHRAPEPLPR